MLSRLGYLLSSGGIRYPWAGKPAGLGCGPWSSSSWAPYRDCLPRFGQRWGSGALPAPGGSSSLCWPNFEDWRRPSPLGSLSGCKEGGDETNGTRDMIIPEGRLVVLHQKIMQSWRPFLQSKEYLNIVRQEPNFVLFFYKAVHSSFHLSSIKIQSQLRITEYLSLNSI